MKREENSSRAHVFYTGRVQGVGFRYTTERLALEAGVTGWVKNLPDGRVEMVAEGSRSKVETLLQRLAESELARHIKKTDARWEPPTGEFADFTVEFVY